MSRRPATAACPTTPAAPAPAASADTASCGAPLPWIIAADHPWAVQLQLARVPLAAIVADAEADLQGEPGAAILDWNAWTVPAVQLLALLSPIVVRRTRGGQWRLLAGARTWAMLWQCLGRDAEVVVLVLSCPRSQAASVRALLAALDAVGQRALHRWAAGLNALRERYERLPSAPLPMLRDAQLQTLAQALGCTTAALAKAVRGQRHEP